MKLEGKVAVVTGAGAGIGEATAHLFAAEGAMLCLNSLSDSALAVTDRINSGGGRAVFKRGDVSVEEDARQIIEAAVEAFGRLDVLFNNAGIVVDGTVETCAIEEYDRCMEINARGVFLCSRFAIPHLRKTRGVIVNCSSVVADKGVVSRAAYSASKGAVSSLTRAMAIDHVQEGIRVNAVCPGTTDTPSLAVRLSRAEDPEEAKRRFIARQAMGRLGTPDEIAQGVLFLATNGFCTGTILTIDGGMTA